MQLVSRKILVVLFFLALALISVSPVVAQDISPTILLSPASSSAMPTPTPVDYTMPYPGLLPDHPLYFLKAFRDRVLAFLISNPIKKADFDLLQADKRVEASYLLVTQEKKMDLAQMTFSKGENYFEDSLSQVRIAKKEGIDMRDFVHKLVLANKKHQEILNNITKGSSSQQQKFADNAKRLKQFEKTVKTLEH